MNPIQTTGWSIPSIPYPSQYIKDLPEALASYDPLSFLSIASQTQLMEIVKFGALVGVFILLLQTIIFNLLIFRRVSSGSMSTRFGFFNVVVYAPFIEELVFRLGGITALYYFTGSIWIAILFTSLAFALAHLIFYGPYKVLNAFFAGIILGVTFLMGGFVACVAAHMTNNLFSMMGV